MTEYNIYDLPPRTEEFDMPPHPAEVCEVSFCEEEDSVSTNNQADPNIKAAPKDPVASKSSCGVIVTLVFIILFLLISMAAIGYGAKEYFKMKENFAAMEKRLDGMEKELNGTQNRYANDTDRRNITLTEIDMRLKNLTATLEKIANDKQKPREKQVMISIKWNATQDTSDYSCNSSVLATSNCSAVCGYSEASVVRNITVDRASDNVAFVINVGLSPVVRFCVQPTTAYADATTESTKYDTTT